MRYLFITVGAPGSGKSTWIKNQGLEMYTISPDQIRLMMESPTYTKNGTLQISQKNDGKVWKLVFEILEHRMQRGETIVIDATHSRTKLINRYRSLAKQYRYRIVAVDFRGIDPEVVLERNRSRLNSDTPWKYVPEDAVKNILERFKYLNIPSGIKVIQPHQFEEFKSILFDFNQYDRINVIGDIHSCATELQQLVKQMGIDFNDSSQFTIFIGDYLDRGNEPVETISYLLNLVDNKNVLFLTGNHELHFRFYKEYQGFREKFSQFPEGSDEYKEVELEYKIFKKNIPPKTRETFFKLWEGGITPKILDKFYSKLGQLAYFKFGDKVYFITHGGYPVRPSLFSKTIDFIKGVGDYEDIRAVAESWIRNTPSNYIQIHGHRDPFSEGPEIIKNRYYVINGDFDQNGALKGLVITKEDIGYFSVEDTEGKYRTNYLQNILETQRNKSLHLLESKDLFNLFNMHSWIKTKEVLPNVYSVNFTSQAFKSKKWDSFTIHARGLFLKDDGTIVARGYEKFFNINERETTRVNTLKFYEYPVSIYEKANGFLGLLSVYNNEWFIASKTSISGEYSEVFRKLIEPYLTESLKNYISNKNVTLVFEVIEPEFDPHIQAYDSPQLVLLDVIKNQFEFKKLPYSELKSTVSLFKPNELIRVKLKISTIANFLSLKEFIEQYKNQEVLVNSGIEGFVFEFGDETSPKMVKLKTNWYSFWKYMRAVSERVRKQYTQGKLDNSTIPNISKDLHTYEEQFVFRKLLEKPELSTKSIIEIRKEVLNAK